jgi:hypothetical protein
LEFFLGYCIILDSHESKSGPLKILRFNLKHRVVTANAL